MDIPYQKPIQDVETINILGVRVDLLTVPQLHQAIAAHIAQKNHALALNVNINCLNLAYQHNWLKNFLNSAELVFCDGAGVILGARILGYHIPQRITYADWMWQLAEFAEPRRFTFFLLGGQPGIVNQAADQLRRRFPDIQIVGAQHGYFDKQPNHPENEAVLAQINALEPNILIVGFGMPLQERWLMENWPRLQANVALTGGAVFDYVSGELRRGPKWMTDHGLEWLARLLIEPRRLWKRYLIGNPLFFGRIFRQRITGWPSSTVEDTFQ